MEPIRLDRGFSADYAVVPRYGPGHPSEGLPVAGVYNGTESLDLTIESLSCVEAVLTDSSVTWLVPATPTIKLHLDESDAGTLDSGLYRVEIGLTGASGKRVMLAERLLKIRGC